MKIAIHATNVSGAGAIVLCKSLFRALSSALRAGATETYFLSEGSPLIPEIGSSNVSLNYRPKYFNGILRVIESLFPSPILFQFDVVLIMGDIPLRLNVPQIVYVHQPHLIKPNVDGNASKSIKYRLMRFIFRLNLTYANTIVVQTESMRNMLVKSYPRIGRIVVIGVPPSEIYLRSPQCTPRSRIPTGLRLFYPASSYPHKNHSLIAKLNEKQLDELNVEEIVLTINESHRPDFPSSRYKLVGSISPEECRRFYRNSDALLFPSKNESYGIPLVEAMYMNIFIVCPRLDYSRALCGDGAIYFNSDSLPSLIDALKELWLRVSSGESPCWKSQLTKIPNCWQDVSNKIFDEMLAVSS